MSAELPVSAAADGRGESVSAAVSAVGGGGQGPPVWLGRATWTVLGTTLVIGVVLWAGWQLRPLLLRGFVALFLAWAFEPGVARLTRRGWSRPRAAAVVILSAVVVSASTLVAVGSVIAAQAGDLAARIPSYLDAATRLANERFSLEISLQEVRTGASGGVRTFAVSLIDEAASLGASLVGFLVQALTVLLLAFYLTADGPRFRRSVCRLFPPHQQRRLLRAWEVAVLRTGGWLRARVLLAAASAAFHAVAFLVIGVPNPLAMAIWVGVVSQFVPTIGTYLAGVLPVVVMLATDPVQALWVIVALTVYQQVENVIVSPPLNARTLEINPAVAFVSVLVGAALLGPLGAFLALPIAATITSLWIEWARLNEVIDSDLTALDMPPPRRRRRSAGPSAEQPTA